jgi:hypothetical protein
MSSGTFQMLTGTLQTITMSDDYDLTAVFATTSDKQLTLAVAGTGTITVTINSVSQSVTAYSGYFPAATSIDLTPVCTAPVLFSYWKAASGTSLPAAFDPLSSSKQTITMSSTYNLTANFTSGTNVTLKVTVGMLGSGTGTGKVDIKIGTDVIATVESTYTMNLSSGTAVSLVANASGSTFSFWSGTTEGTTSPLNLPMTSNEEIVAVFSTTPAYNLTVAVTGNGTVDATIGGYPITISDYSSGISVGAGTPVVLTPVPGSGSSFSNWIGYPSGTTDQDDPLSFSMGAAYSITARFVSASAYTLSVTIINSGTVTVTVDGTDSVYTSSFSTQIDNGKAVVMKATATGTGNAFSYWSGTYEGTSTTASFTMTKNYTVNAVFTAGAYYTLDLAFSSAGAASDTISVTTTLGSFAYTRTMTGGVNIDQGTSVTVNAVHGTGSQFSYWSSTPVPTGFRATEASNTFVIDTGYSLTANFAGAGYTTLTLGITGNGSITLAIGGSTDTLQAADMPYTGYFNPTDTVTLTATPNGNQFSYWNVVVGSMPAGFDITGPAAQTITMAANYSLNAVFTTGATPYTLDIEAQGNGTVTIALGAIGTYTVPSGGSKTLYLDSGAAVKLTATAASSNYFSYWSVNNVATPASFDISKSTEQTITMASNYNLTAVFTSGGNTLTLAVSGNGTIAVSIDGGTFTVGTAGYTGRFPAGTNIDLAAAPGGTNHFSYWSGTLPAAVTDVVDPSQSISMNANCTMTANFTSNSGFLLTVGIDGAGSAQVKLGTDVVATFTANNAIYVSSGTSVTLTATATTGVFSFWSGTTSSAANVMTFTMPSSAVNETAVFTDGSNDQVLSVSVNNAAYGSVTTNVTIGATTYTVALTGNYSLTLSENTAVSLVPVQIPNSKFSYWDGTTVSTASPLNLTMDKPYSETAVFTDGVNDVALTVTFNSAVGKVDLTTSLSASAIPLVSGQTVYLSNGLNISLTADVLTGLPNHFSYWSGGATSIDNPYSTVMNNDLTIAANFTNGLNDQSLDLTAVGGGTITLVVTAANVTITDITSGHTWFNGGSAISLAAVDGAQSFAYWTVSGTSPASFDTSKAAAQSVTMNASYDLTATFATGSNLTITTTAGGTVTYSYIDGSNTITGTVGDGTAAASKILNVSPAVTSISLTANAYSSSYVFMNWTGLLTSAVSPGTINVTAGTVGAVFALKSSTYALEITSTAGGHVTYSYINGTTVTGDVGDGTTPSSQTINVPNGTDVDLTAVPDTAGGYVFTNWTGLLTSAVPTGTVNAAGTVGAVFALKINTYALEITSTAGGYVTYSYGAVLGNVGDSATPSPQTINVPNGTDVDLTAVPDTAGGYVFTNWTGTGLLTSAVPTGTVNSAGTVGAVFDQKTNTYALTIISTTGGHVTYTYGSVTGNVGDATTPSPQTLNVQKTVASVGLTATADSSYAFVYWSGDLSSFNVTDTLTMGADRSVTANFASSSDLKTLTVSTDGGPGRVMITLPGTTPILLVESTNGTAATRTISLPTGMQGTLKAETNTANTYFTLWNSNDAPALSGFTPAVNFTLSGNQSATAVFTGTDTKTLTLTVTGTGTITMVIDNKYTMTGIITEVNGMHLNTNVDVELTAVAVTAGDFLNWSGSVSGTTNPVSFKMDANKSITANFKASGALQVTIGVPNSDGSVGVYIDRNDGSGYTFITTVTGGNYITFANSGAKVRLVANSDFSYWATTGTAAGVTNPLEFTLATDSVIVDAYFAQTGNNLTINTVDIAGTGTLSITLGGNTASQFTVTKADVPVVIRLAPGTQVDIAATAGTVSYWTGSHPGVGQSLTFSMGTAAESVTANFVSGTPVNLTLSVDPAGTGLVKVTVGGTEIYSGTGTTIPFTSGTAVNISALASSGHFSHWIANGTAPAVFDLFNAAQTITMNASYSFTASFTATGSEFTLDLDVGGTGTGSINVTVDGGTQNVTSAIILYFASGENVGLTTSATAPNVFSYWDITGSVPAMSSGTFQMLTGTLQTITMSGNYDLTAVFADTTSDKQLTLAVAGTGTITVTINGASQSVTSYNGYFPAATSIDLTPVCTAPVLFSYWKAASGTSLPATFDPLSSSKQTITMSSTYNLTANFTSGTSFLLTVNVAMIGSGTGTGTVDIMIGGNTIAAVTTASTVNLSSGTAVSLVANASGSTFSFWSGTTEGTTSPLAVSMTKTQTITAVFSTTPAYLLKVGVSGPGSVVATIGTYPITISNFSAGVMVGAGTMVSLSANPTSGNSFDNWIGTPFPGSPATDTDNPLEFNMDMAYSLTARFVGASAYTLSVAIINSGSVTVTVNGVTGTPQTSSFTMQIDSGDSVQMVAATLTGATNAFSFWSGDYSGVSTTASFTMDQPYTITAVFTSGAYKTLTLLFNVGGATDDAIDVTTALGSFTYPRGMTGGLNVDVGTNVTVEAVHGTGDQFSYWSSSALPTSFNAGLAGNTFSMAADYTLTANFTSAAYQSLTLGLSPSGTTGVITVVVGGQTFAIGAADLPYVGYFDTNSNVSVSAAITAPRMFSYWDITGATPASFNITSGSAQTIVMNADYSLTAVFTGNSPHTLTLTPAGNGTIEVSIGNGTYTVGAAGIVLNLDAGASVDVTANALSDVFSYWSVNNGATPASFDISKDTMQTITMGTTNYNLTAVFISGGNTLTLAVAGGTGSITVSIDGGSFSVGTAGYTGHFASTKSIDLTATPSGTSNFSYWSTASGMPMPTSVTNALSAAQTITVNGNYGMTANFTSGPTSLLTIGIDGSGSVEIQLNSVAVATITASGTMYVSNGTSVKLTATPTAGAFSFWDGTNDSLNPVLTFTMTSAVSETAVFTTATYQTLTLAVDTPGGTTLAGTTINTTVAIGGNTYTISVLGPINLSSGVSVSLVPVGVGQQFSYWTGDTTSVDNPLLLTMGQPHSYTANFTGANYVALTVNFNTSRGDVTLTVPTISSLPVTLTDGQAVYLTKGLAVTLTPVATAPSHFSYWSGGMMKLDDPLSFNMNNNYTLDANFTDGNNDRQLALSVGPNGGMGTVSLYIGPMGAIGPFTVSLTNTIWLSNGESASVMPQPDTGYMFSQWVSNSTPASFNVSSSAQQTFVMGGSYDLKAYFVAAGGPVLILSTYPANTGTFQYRISGTTAWIDYTSQVVFNPSDVVDVQVNPNPGFTFQFWNDASISNPKTVTMPAAGTVNLTAYILTGDTVTVTLNASPISSAGTFTWSLPGMSATNTYAGPFQVNKSDVLTVIASPVAGYVFKFWDDASTNAARVVGQQAANVTFTAYFLSTNPNDLATITLTASPSGSGSFKWSLAGMTAPNTYTGPFQINKVDDLTVITAPTGSYPFQHWDDMSTNMTRHVNTQSSDATFTAYFEIIIKVWTIKATSDTGSTITPSGVVKVTAGNSQTFRFSAAQGLMVASVIVDGVALTQDEIASGSYTFYNVGMDHTISVYSATSPLRDDISLTIDVTGDGYVEYSINGSAYVRYTQVVLLNPGDDVKLRAVANDGSEFDRWEIPAVQTSQELTFNNVTKDTLPGHLALFFKDVEEGHGILQWIVLAIVVLILVGVLIWFLLAKRRKNKDDEESQYQQQ